jgi:hypothetical protein
MTVTTARRSRRRAAATTPSPLPAPGESMTIGEIDQTVVDCPACGRPLALGARRCPGCRSRLIGGVVISKIAPFVAAGLAVGLLTGAGSGFLLGRSLAPAPALVAAVGDASAAPGSPAPSVGASASVAPSASAVATPTAPPVTSIPPAARAALTQAVEMNDRLAASLGDLRAALAARSFDASEVARILRTISADSVYAEQLADRVATWSGGAEVAAQLAAFYGAVHDTAADGLVASVRNEAAYRATATSMVGLLSGLGLVDAGLRAAAAEAGISLPPAATP